MEQKLEKQMELVMVEKLEYRRESQMEESMGLRSEYWKESAKDFLTVELKEKASE